MPHDHDSLEEVLLSNLDWVRGLARSLISDPTLVEDVVHEAWLAARTQPPPVLRSGARAWLTAVVRNRVRRMARADRRRSAREQAVAEAAELPSTAAIVVRGAMYHEVVAAVMALDEPYRSAILWRYLDDVSAREVAARQGVSHDAARQRISRGLKMLRQRLGSAHAGGFVAFSAAWGRHLGVVPAVTAVEAAPSGMAFWLLGNLSWVASGIAAVCALTLYLAISNAPDVLPPSTQTVRVVAVDEGGGEAEGFAAPRRLAMPSTWQFDVVDTDGRPCDDVIALALVGGHLVAKATGDAAGHVVLVHDPAVDEVLLARPGAVPIRRASAAVGRRVCYPQGAVVGCNVRLPKSSEACPLALRHDREQRWGNGLDERALAVLARLGVTPQSLSLSVTHSGAFRFAGLPRDWSGLLQAGRGWALQTDRGRARGGNGARVLLLGPATNLDIELFPPVFVEGRLMAAGEPVSGRRMQVIKSGQFGQSLQSAVSGTDGHFKVRFGRPPAGREARAELLVSSDSGGPLWQRSIVVAPGATGVQVGDIDLGRGLDVCVRAVDGRALPDATVTIGAPNGACVIASSDADGNVRCSSVPASASHVSIRARGYRTSVLALPVESRVTVRLQIGNGLEVTTVGPDGRRVRGLRLRVEAAQMPFRPAIGSTSSVFPQLLAFDKNGYLLLSDLRPGSAVRLVAIDQLGSTLAHAEVVVPPDGRIDRIELRVGSPFFCTGIVHSETGLALSHVRVSAERGEDRIEVETDPHGRFRLGPIHAAVASVRLMIEHPAFVSVRDTVALAAGIEFPPITLVEGRIVRAAVRQASGAAVTPWAGAITLVDGSVVAGRFPEPGVIVFDNVARLCGELSVMLGGRRFTQAVSMDAEQLQVLLPALGLLAVPWPNAVDPSDSCIRVGVVVTPLQPDGRDGEPEYHYFRTGGGSCPDALQVQLPAGRYRLQLEVHALIGTRQLTRSLGASREIDVLANSCREVVMP